MALASVGPYEILEKIGQGAMGEVFLANDPRLHRKVAIKRLSSQGSDSVHDNKHALHEARSVARLNHPNIAGIYDILDSDGRAHIVMEYVRGRSLASLIEQGGMAPTSVASIGCQIADGLAEAHRAGIIHRDLKPANIVVDRAGQAKILDFGIAHRLPSETSSTSTHATGDAGDGNADDDRPGAGTPAYMAPERLRGDPATARSDIYSLGVILFECLAGVRPFGGSVADLRHAVLHDPLPDLADLAPESPHALNTIVGRALERDPTKRYATAAELRRDLVAFEASLSAGTTTGHSTHRDRFGRRAAIAASLAVVVAALVGVGLWRRPTAPPACPGLALWPSCRLQRSATILHWPPTRPGWHPGL